MSACQQRLPFVATAGNEMKIMMTIDSFETRRHGSP
jgi:hypothetical protein